MKKLVAFGEIMVRLNPPGYIRLCQADELLVGYTGAEANVCAALSYQGLETEFVTRMPDNDVTTCAMMNMHRCGVGTKHWVYGGDRVGLYYLEKGAAQRPSKVIYDRKYSSITESRPSDYDWDEILKNADAFHVTGITPALGGELPEICEEAMKAAKRHNVKVFMDLNYRRKLWKPEQAQRVMRRLAGYADVMIGNEEDAALSLGIGGGDAAKKLPCIESYAETAKKIIDEFGCKAVAFSLRTSISASDNDWQGMLYENGKAYLSPKYSMRIVDRVGGGDSFAAGIIYSALNSYDPQKTINFAVAASCLKHSIEFDFNFSSISEIETLMNGDGSGRVVR